MLLISQHSLIDEYNENFTKRLSNELTKQMYLLLSDVAIIYSICFIVRMMKFLESH
jgi:hypothetical protein